MTYKEALEKILSLRSNFENVDEWVEAEAFNECEEIAKKALQEGDEKSCLI